MSTFNGAIIGCPGDTENGINSGSVVGVVKNSGSGWAYQGEYYLPDPSAEDQFG